MTSNKKWGLGTLLAMIAAFFTGWLTAPQSGKETREDIKDAALNAKTEAEKQLSQVADEVKELTKKGTERANELKDSAKAEYDKLVKEAKAAQEKAITVLDAVKSGQSDSPELDKAVKQAKNAKDNLMKFWSAR